jgi:hypothetical protein
MYKSLDHPNETNEGLLSIANGVFGTPFVLAPGEERFDGAPCVPGALASSVVPVPD